MNDEPNFDIEKLQQKISENPQDAKAYSLLGTAFTMQKRFRKSIDAFEKALRLNPKDDHAEFALCVLVSGADPIVEPSVDLLNFLNEHGGVFVKMMHRSADIPPATDVKLPMG